MAIRTLPVGSDSAGRGPTCCGPGRVPVFKLLATVSKVRRPTVTGKNGAGWGKFSSTRSGSQSYGRVS
jgi:hypothetical protein